MVTRLCWLRDSVLGGFSPVAIPRRLSAVCRRRVSCCHDLWRHSWYQAPVGRHSATDGITAELPSARSHCGDGGSVFRWSQNVCELLGRAAPLSLVPRCPITSRATAEEHLSTPEYPCGGSEIQGAALAFLATRPGLVCLRPCPLFSLLHHMKPSVRQSQHTQLRDSACRPGPPVAWHQRTNKPAAVAGGVTECDVTQCRAGPTAVPGRVGVAARWSVPPRSCDAGRRAAPLGRQGRPGPA